MKSLYIFSFIFLSATAFSQFNFQRSWGTYFGDERLIFTDSAVDTNGNLYIIGVIDGTNITNLPIFTNANSYNPNYGGGTTDGFLIKFNPAGQIVWGTFIGGENQDRLAAIAIDKDDNIYITGDTNSETNISTLNAYQENYAGNTDFFISKFTENGSIIWSTYYGGSGDDTNPLTISSLIGFPSRMSIALDGNGFFYITGQTASSTLSTPNVFQENKANSNYLIAKFNENGNRIWATYFGVNTTWISSLVANTNAVYVAGNARDCPPSGSFNTYYGTANGFKSTPNGCREIFLNKFNAITGQREWGTYYGGAQLITAFFKSIALVDDKVYLSGISTGSNANQEVATLNSFQPTSNGNSNFIAQFNENGTRNWGTYNGNLQSNSAGIGAIQSNVSIDNSGNFYNYGSTGLTDIATSDGYKLNPTSFNEPDGFVCKFGSNNNKIWGTYYGGDLGEANVRFHEYNNGNKFYIVGTTQSVTQIATANGYQPIKQVFDLVNNTYQSAYTIFIAHFEPNALSTTTNRENLFAIYPNPTSGNFTIAIENFNNEDYTLELYDIIGKKLYEQPIQAAQTSIQTSSLSKGVYFVTINSNKGKSSKKIIVE